MPGAASHAPPPAALPDGRGSGVAARAPGRSTRRYLNSSLRMPWRVMSLCSWRVLTPASLAERLMRPL